MGERKLALVTGASSGIGRELARQFADHDYDVVVVAADAITTATGDLGASGTTITPVRGPRAGIRRRGGARRGGAVCRPLDAVALNAGVGNSGAFLDIPWADESRLLGVDVASTVHLAKVPNIVQHGEGVLLLTSSVAATMPGPYYATYSASKAFMLSSAKALRHEVQDNGVTVTALMPGPTDTDFFDRAGMQDTPIYDADKDGPADVAKDGFEALMAGKDRVVAGSMKNRMQTAAGQVLPERARLRCTHA